MLPPTLDPTVPLPRGHYFQMPGALWRLAMKEFMNEPLLVDVFLGDADAS